MLGVISNYDKDMGTEFRKGEPNLELHRRLLRAVHFFHQNQVRFTQKDINQYKDLIELNKAIELVEENIKQKELEKQHKKERDVVYKDDRWFVVVPKSHKASCTYGAGTKWCVTMKNDEQYWNRYSRNATFFFIIDKSKQQHDPLYKVAYRIIGHKGKYELWDATDREISKNRIGEEYFEDLPPKLRIDTRDYHDEHFVGVDPSHLENDPRGQALANHLDTADVEDIDDHHYGIPIYEVDDETWSVGDEDELQDAMRTTYEDYYEEDLVDYYDPEGYYLEMDDMDSFIDEDVDNYLADLSDLEKLEYAGKEDEYEELSDALSETEDEDEMSTLQGQMENLLDESDQVIHNSMTDEWHRCFRNGVVDCLVNEKGWYGNARGLFNSGLVSLNKDDLIDSIVGDSDYDSICPYGWDESQDNEGNTWIVFQVDY
jgi:hypothetical protein